MIDETLAKIEARLGGNPTLSAEGKAEMQALLAQLKGEIAALSHTDADVARSIAGFTDVSTHEATRAPRNPRALQHALDGLTSSVDGFEKSHPSLVDAVNRICVALANFGM